MTSNSLATVRSLDDRPGSRPPAGAHLVQFYDDDAFLSTTVADFIADGLKDGEPVVVIATEEHRAAFRAALASIGVDVQGAEASGTLALHDARSMLDSFMVDGMPERGRFRLQVGSLLDKGLAGGRASRMRAYGEMVDLLWREGKPQAAIHLEELWNDLATVHSFSLLCAYVMGNFYKEAHAGELQQICSAHAHVFPAETYDRNADADSRLREVARLQQRARALEHELEHRKELENELREALSQRRRLEEELRRQNEDLTKTVRFSDLFVGILGHDLRNPLSAIITGASLLARRADSERVAKPATRIVNSAARMGRMIDQLLDFTRVRVGTGIPLERREMDLAEVCRVAIDELDSAQGPKVVLDVRGDVIGHWDGDRLTQLVSNLVGNALAHGSQESPVEIRVDGASDGPVLLSVENAGAICADVLSVIFEPFRSAANQKQEGSSGLGLGLYISQQIVLAHSGTIEASSRSGRTGFTVRLPRNPSSR